jgi:hypothetical protein
MFYEAVELENILICMICENKFLDPRILPCGRTFCNSCIEHMTDTNKKKVKCNFCSKTHEIPNEGFMPNLDMARIVQLKSNEIFRSRLDRELKTKSDNLRKNVEKALSDLDIGETLIRANCDKVRNDIQLAIEQAHVKLDEIHKELMDSVDSHEKKLQANFRIRQKDFKEIFVQKLNHSRKFYEKSSNLLKKFQIEEYELKKTTNEADSLLYDINKFHCEIKNAMFESTFLKFLSSSDGLKSTTIGRLKRQNINLHYLENSGSIRELNLLPKLFNVDTDSDDIYIRPFKYDALLCLYKTQSIPETLSLVCFNKDGNILIQKNNFIKIKYSLDSVKILTNSFNNLFVYVDDCSDEYIYSFDEDLNLIAHIEWDHNRSVVNIACNYRNLFILNTKNDNCSIIRVYNHELELINTLGQGDKESPYYFSSRIEILLVTDQFFIVCEEDIENNEEDDSGDISILVSFINKTSGIVEKNWNILGKMDEMAWSLYMDNFIVIHRKYTDDDLNKILCLNFDGVSLDRSKMNENMFKDAYFQCVSNKELYFFDQLKKKLFYF